MAGSSRAPHAAHAGRLRRPVLLAAAGATLLILVWQASQLFYGTRHTHGQAAAQVAAQLNATRSALVASKQLADGLARQLTTATSQKVEAERALAQAQAQQQALQQQLQLQQKQLQELQQQQAAQPSSPQGQQPGLHLLEVAGLQCRAVQDQEFWADDTVVWGSDHRARDAAECCAACHAYTAAVERGGGEKGRNSSRCNVWAFCADAAKCKERHGECWLKHERKPLPPPPALPPGARASPGWVSGAVYPDPDALLQQHNGSVLVMHTRLGDIRVRLLPALAPASVREVRRMAVLQARGLTPCSNCRIYRPEPNFLVQGLLKAAGSYVTVPRHPSPQQPTTMPRGMVCWAGGSGGPHWFVNLIDQAGFKDEHLCWGQVFATNMSVFDAIVALPRRDKKPGEMNELVEHIRFNVSLAAA